LFTGGYAQACPKKSGVNKMSFLTNYKHEQYAVALILFEIPITDFYNIVVYRIPTTNFNIIQIPADVD